MNTKRHGQKTNQGFTLIELMIVIAIIGVLAAIALPSYQTYIVRSKVTEGLVAMGPAKIAVTEYFSVNQTLPPGGDNVAAGFEQDYDSEYVNTVDWHADQRIEIEFNEAALGISSQLELQLEPQISGNIISSWRCGQDSNVDSSNYRFVPANCRTQYW